MKPTHYIIIILIAIIGAMWFFWPQPKPDTSLQQEIHKLNGELSEARYEISTLLNEREKSKQEGVEKDRAFKATIEGLNSRLAQKREKVITIIQDNPDLKAFVETQDSVIAVQGKRIDTLSADILKQSMDCNKIISRFEGMLQVHAQKDSLQDLQIVGAMRDLRKQKRANRLGKVIAIGLGVIGFITGNQI